MRKELDDRVEASIDAYSQSSLAAMGQVDALQWLQGMSELAYVILDDEEAKKAAIESRFGLWRILLSRIVPSSYIDKKELRELRLRVEELMLLMEMSEEETEDENERRKVERLLKNEAFCLLVQFQMMAAKGGFKLRKLTERMTIIEHQQQKRGLF